MNLETWRSGINISIENVLNLYKDGNLLLGNGSYGHECFYYINTLEEMGVAYKNRIARIL